MTDQFLDQGIPAPQPTTPDISATHEAELSPANLARSWLAYRGAEVQREIARTEDSLRFNRNYKPTSPGPTPSWVEPGGTDASDWAATHYEYNHWPEEQAELEEYAEGKLEELDEARTTIEDDMDRIAAGDTAVIDRYALLETERRAKLEAERQRRAEKEHKAEEARIGQEFDGATEVVATVGELMQLVRAGTISENIRGSQGWKVGRYWPEQASHTSNGVSVNSYERVILEHDAREGSHGEPELSFTVSSIPEGGYGLSVSDLRNAEEIPYTGDRRNAARKGKYMSVDVRGNRGTDYAVRDLIQKKTMGICRI